MSRPIQLSALVLTALVSSPAIAANDVCDAYGLLVGDSQLGDADTAFGGVHAYDFAGYSIEDVGDVNGDGFNDLLMGAPGADQAGRASGSAYLFFGPLGPTGETDVSSADVVIRGMGENDLFGVSSAAAGDVNSDGYADFWVGAPSSGFGDNPLGYVALFHGGPSLAAEMSAGTHAMAVVQGGVPGGNFGWAVEAGDFNDDGTTDVAVGAPYAGGGKGAAFVFTGPLTGLYEANRDEVVKFVGASTRAAAGFSLAAVDYNADGKTDLAIGSPKDAIASHKAGAVQVVFGGQVLPSVMDMGDADVVLYGAWGDQLATSLAGGDLNNDGFTDLMVGSPRYSVGGNKRGAVFVMYANPAAAGAGYLPSIADVALLGPTAYAEAGSSVAGGVDFDGDGFNDIVVGAAQAGNVDGVQAGAGFVLHGPFASEEDLATADAAFFGGVHGAYAGGAVAVSSGLNADGFADVIVGAWRGNGGASRSGVVGLLFGGDDTADVATYYLDGDADGYGNPAVPLASCAPISGFVLDNGDCNDGASNIHPYADEAACDGTDYNCDGFIGTVDHDGDGFAACDDCDDGAPGVSPAATEVCDGIDNNCASGADEPAAIDALTWYFDVDGDGYGLQELPMVACNMPDVNAWLINDGGDCDDSDGDVNPAAHEYCDNVDNNCVNGVDEATAVDAVEFFEDADGDGFGTIGTTAVGCTAPAGFAANRQDCDDTDPNIKPGAAEVCDEVDNDCNGINYLGGQKSAAEASFKLAGNVRNGQLGHAVLFLPDQNADGTDEIVFAAPYDNTGNIAAGAVYMLAGSYRGGDFDLADTLSDGNHWWTARVVSQKNSALFGSSLAQGDINGDGIADLIVGAPGDRTHGAESGRVSVFYGPILGAREQNAADLQVGGAFGVLLGSSVASADLDNDGYDDLIATGPGANAGDGATYILYGGPSLSPLQHVTTVDATVAGSTLAGVSEVAEIGDINNDGIQDIAIGAPQAQNTGGEISIVYGDLERMSGASLANVVWTGTNGDRIGLSVSNGGDLNGDDVDDLLVGSDSNHAWVVFGGATFAATADLGAVVDISFTGALFQKLGRKVAFAGDIDDDGFDDALFGAPTDDGSGHNAGATFVIYGGQTWSDFTDQKGEIYIEDLEHRGYKDQATGEVISAFRSGLMEGAKLLGDGDEGALGTGLAGGGDVNGDGHPDVVVGAPARDAADLSSAGAAYVLFGSEYGTDISVPGIETMFRDVDRDGFGTDTDTVDACPMHVELHSDGNPAYVYNHRPWNWADAADCDESDASIFPYATEVPTDLVDQDCDGKDDPDVLPNVSLCDIDNLTPISLDDLTALTAIGDGDDSAEELSIWFKWFANGELRYSGGGMLPASLISKYETIRVECTPFDGWLPGTTVASADVFVENSPPTAPTVHLGPTGATGQNVVNAIIDVPAGDPDGDGTSYTYTWFVNNVLVDGQTGSSLSNSFFVKSDVVRVDVATTDGLLWAPLVSDSITIVNAPPSMVGMRITPQVATVQDTLSMEILTPSVDPDGDEVTYTYQWKVNYDWVSTASSITSATGFGLNDLVYLFVTASDGESSSAPALNIITIRNAVPDAPTMVITSNPMVDDNIVCSWVETPVDPDGHTLGYVWRWKVNGVDYTGPLTATLTGGDTMPGGNVVKGDVVSCSVTLHDGWGAWVTGNYPATTVVNTPPAAPSIGLSPVGADTNDIVSVVITAPASDADGDSFTYDYAWTVNGAPKGTNVGTLAPANFSKSDLVAVQVVANDGTDTSPVAGANLTIQNAVPTDPAVHIDPSPADVTDAISVVVDTASTDADGDDVTYVYAWTINGAAAAGSASLTASVVRDDVVRVTVHGTDGADTSANVFDEITIVNAPPVKPVMTVTNSPTVEDNIICAWTTTPSDPDGDGLGYTWRWKVNGSTYSGPISTTLMFGDTIPLGNVAKGDSVQCSLTLVDGNGGLVNADYVGTTVANGAPSAPAISLTPAGADRTDAITINIDTPSVDPDGDAFTYAYSWLVNGTVVPGQTAATLPVGNYVKGNLVTGRILSDDGDDDSGLVTTSLVVANAPPEGLAISMTPAGANRADALTAVLDSAATDPDGDSVTHYYSWTINGGSSVSGATSISSGYVRGDVVRVSVYATDGAENTPVVFVEQTIANSPPDAAVVSLPASPTDEDAVHCSIVSAGNDADGDSMGYTWRWKVEGVTYTGPLAQTVLWGDTIPAGNLAVGDEVRCSLTLNDGNGGIVDGAEAVTTVIDFRNWEVSDPTTNVIGTVVDDQGIPLVGATVSVLNADPAISTTTDGSGDFSINAPWATFGINMQKAGHSGVLTYLNSSGTTIDLGTNYRLITPAYEGEIEFSSGRTLDPAKGGVMSVYNTASDYGGQGFTVNPSPDTTPLSNNYMDMWVVAPTQEVLPAESGMKALFHTNIPVGTAQITGVASGEGETCTSDYPLNTDFEVLANTWTLLNASCSWDSGPWTPPDPPWTEGSGGSDITLVGYVTDMLTDLPISGAKVKNITTGSEVTTAADGTFSLGGVSPDDVVKWYHPAGGYWASVEVIPTDEPNGTWEWSVGIGSDHFMNVMAAFSGFSQNPDPLKAMVMMTVSPDGISLGGQVLQLNETYAELVTYDSNGDPVLNNTTVQENAAPGLAGEEGTTMALFADVTLDASHNMVVVPDTGEACDIDADWTTVSFEAKTIYMPWFDCAASGPSATIYIKDAVTDADLTGVTVQLDGVNSQASGNAHTVNTLELPQKLEISKTGYWGLILPVNTWTDVDGMTLYLVSDAEVNTRSNAAHGVNAAGSGVIGDFTGVLNAGGGEHFTVDTATPLEWILEGTGAVDANVLTSTSQSKVEVVQVNQTTDLKIEVAGVPGTNICYPDNFGWMGQIPAQDHFFTMVNITCDNPPADGMQMVPVYIDVVADANPTENTFNLICTGLGLPAVSVTLDLIDANALNTEVVMVANGQSCSLWTTDSGADGGPQVTLSSCDTVLDTFTVVGSGGNESSISPEACGTSPGYCGAYFTYQQSDTWVDDALGNNTTGDGSYNNPYKTITKGLAMAADDTTVSVMPGTYYERFNITGDKKVIAVGGPEVTTIDDAQPMCGGCASNSLILIYGGMLEGFTINRNESAAMIQIYGEAIINRNIVIGPSNVGTAVYFPNVGGPWDVQIKNNTFVNFYRTIYTASTNHTVGKVEVINNIFAHNDYREVLAYRGEWVYDHNITWDGLYGPYFDPTYAIAHVGSNNFGDTDPKFMDEGSNDYRLQADSPAINGGEVLFDFDSGAVMYADSDCRQPTVGAVREERNLMTFNMPIEAVGQYTNPSAETVTIDNYTWHDGTDDWSLFGNYDNLGDHVVGYRVSDTNWARIDWQWHGGDLYSCFQTGYANSAAAWAASRPTDTTPDTAGCNGAAWTLLQ